VLKLPASDAGGAAEIAALQAWRGRGAARVLRHDPVQGAVLLNFLGWVGQGTFGLEDVLGLTDQLHEADASSYAFAPVDTNLARRIGWAAERFAGPGHEHHRADLEIAEKLLVDLLFTDQPQVLLHGDLQAKNLIVSDVGLTAVDPLPVLGPALVDIAFWIAKSLHEEPTVTYVDKVGALRSDLDTTELLRWTWALAVLENRPYLTSNAQRQEFVDGLRSRMSA
jgi:streptomycin 6-kinase